MVFLEKKATRRTGEEEERGYGGAVRQENSHDEFGLSGKRRRQGGKVDCGERDEIVYEGL